MRRRADREEERRKAAGRAGLIMEIQSKIGSSAASLGATYLEGFSLSVNPPHDLAGYMSAGAVPQLQFPDLASIVIWSRNPAGEMTGGQRALLEPDGTYPKWLDNCRISFGKRKDPSLSCPESATAFRSSLPKAPRPRSRSGQQRDWRGGRSPMWQAFPSARNPTGRTVCFASDRDAPKAPPGRHSTMRSSTTGFEGCTIKVIGAPEPAGSKRDFDDTLMRAGAPAVAACFEAPLSDPRDGRSRFTVPRSMSAPRYRGYPSASRAGRVATP